MHTRRSLPAKLILRQVAVCRSACSAVRCVRLLGEASGQGAANERTPSRYRLCSCGAAVLGLNVTLLAHVGDGKSRVDDRGSVSRRDLATQG